MVPVPAAVRGAETSDDKEGRMPDARPQDGLSDNPAWLVMHICAAFLGPIVRSLESADRRVGAGSALWMAGVLRDAVDSVMADACPPPIVMRGDEPVSVAVSASNTLSFNIAFPGAPLVVGEDGDLRWEAFRRPVSYVALLRSADHGDWLCRVMCPRGSPVSVSCLNSGAEAGPFPAGTAFAWAGRNIRVRLGTGPHTFVALFTPAAPPAKM